MAEALQFHCPSCGSVLRIPSTGAGMRGPCPHCRQPIVAPDPLRGIPAFVLATAPAEPAPAPTPTQSPVHPPQAVGIPLATIIHEPQAPPAPPQATVVHEPAIPHPPIVPQAAYVPPAPPVEAPSTVLVNPAPAPPPSVAAPAPTAATTPSPVTATRSGLPIALIVGTLAAVLAFAGGYQSGHQNPATPKAEPEAPTAAPLVEPVIPKAKVVEEPAEATHSPHQPTLAEPRHVLESFLAAPTWQQRAAFALYPDQAKPRMKNYYAVHPDKATAYDQLVVEHAEVNESTGLLLAVFRVHTSQFPKGYPVAVAETPTGWLVDWATFIEYQDSLFQKFLEGDGDAEGIFHLIVRQSPQPSKTADRIDYDLITATPGAPQKASAAKNSAAASQLAEVTGDGNVATPVLQLARRTNPDGTKRIEILAVPATDWRPRPEQ
ncbi:hypothetical protein [Luteolibacter sp. LG18]|uniref:hypothetical protein n=1 Tax=Luteolibacter sp. LG18 TaxID=2819286 RepID=UPI002B2BC7C9|nr:hypothetical protein llg_02730 [Luteolibacter sp. LG18]